MTFIQRSPLAPRAPWRVLRLCAAVALLALAAACADHSPDALVNSAKEYIAKNDRNAAVIQLKNVLQENPNHAEARFLLGRTLLETGDVLGAEKELRKALELNYPAKQVNPVLARTLVVGGQPEKAVKEFASAEAADAHGTAELKTAIGQAELALGHVDQARSALKQARAADAQYAPAMVGEARVEAVAGNLEGALKLTEAATAAAPGMAEAWQLQGEILAMRKENDKALAAYRKSVEADKNYLPGHSALITALLQGGNVAEASKALANLKTIAPKHPQTYYLEALVRTQEKNFTAARDAIQEVLRVAPDNPRALLVAGMVDHQLKSYGQAEANFSKVVQQAPDNLFARRMLIANYVVSGQTSKAVDALKPIAAKLDSDPGLLNLAGEVYLRNGDVSAAASYFEKAARLDPAGTRQRTGLALTHLARGESDRGLQELETLASKDNDTGPDLALIAASMERRQYDKALAAIDGLEKKLPNKPVPANLRGLAYLAKNDKAAARSAFEKAVAIDPNFLPAVANLARMDLAEKQPAAAEKRFQTVVDKNPSNAQALLSLAEMRRANGASAEEVAGLIGKAVAAAPTDVAPRAALIQHWLRAKDPKKAVAAGQEALAAMPNQPQILDMLGQAYFAAGETNQALATFNREAEAMPGSPVPWIRIADVHIAKKDLDAAAQALQKALAAKPDSIEAERALATVEVRRDNVPRALDIARQVQKQRPKEPVGYILEGDVHASKKAWTEAVAAYRTGVKQTGNVDAAMKLHAALVAANQQGEADKVASSWIKEHANDTAFRLYLADSAVRHLDFRGALKYYEAVLEKQPDNPVVLNNFAWAAGRVNDPRALGAAEKANRLAPNQPLILDTLGSLLIEQGDKGRAVEVLRKAAELAPTVPTIRLNLAKALATTGQKDAARRELDELAKLGDQHPLAPEVARVRASL